MTAASEHGVGAWLGVPQGLLRLTGPSLEGERVFTSESMTLTLLKLSLDGCSTGPKNYIKLALNTRSISYQPFK